MAGPAGIVGRWFGNAISEATAFAAGIAIGPVLGPPVQALQNATWATYPDKPLDAGTAADGVAHGKLPDAEARAWARSHGIGDAVFNAMIADAESGPGIAYGFELWRRGLITQGDFATVLKRAGLADTWGAPLEGLRDTLLSSPELGMMQQQGFIDAGRANSEGALQGVTNERQQLRFEASGLPPGVAEALTMLRRGIIDTATFSTIVREGHTKTKYTGVLEQLQNQVLSHIQYVEARVRGWITNAQMYAGGALTGYQQADLDLLHKIHGRPLSWHQVWIGLQRGGKRLDPTADITAASTGIDPDFFSALQQSDIQQQWYDLAWVQRYNYPSAFVLRALRTGGEIDDATLRETLKFVGWEPSFIDKVAVAWTPTGAAAKTDPYIAKADSQLWTEIHKAYVKVGISQATADGALAVLVPVQADRQTIFARWDEEKVLVSTPAGG